jgi:hypothetical protein
MITFLQFSIGSAVISCRKFLRTSEETLLSPVRPNG